MENSLQQFNISESSKQRYYNLTITIAILITVALVGFFLYFSSKAFRQILHIQRKIELMFSGVRLDYIRQVRIEEPASQPRSRQGKVLKHSYNLNQVDVIAQKEQIDFAEMMKINVKKYNYLIYYLQKKWRQRKKRSQRKVKVLQTRATLNALMYWCNLLTIWYLSNILASIASRVDPAASLASLTFSLLLIVTVLSSGMSLLLTSFVHLFYENLIEEQILLIFKYKGSVQSHKLHLEQSLEQDEESGVKLFFGQDRRYAMKEVSLQNLNLVRLIFIIVAAASLLFAICLYQMMIMEMTFKKTALIVFLLAPLLDFFLIRNGLIALFSLFRLQKRSSLVQSEQFFKNPPYQSNSERQDESVFELADNSQDLSAMRANSSRSKLNNSIFPLTNPADESSRNSFLEEDLKGEGKRMGKERSNINELFQNVAFYFEQSLEQSEELQRTFFKEFQKREMGWLEEKLKLYDMVLLSFIDQTYGSVGGYKIIRNIQKSQNYDLIERLKEKVFNIKEQDDSLLNQSDSFQCSFDLKQQEQSFVPSPKRLHIVEEVQEEMEQTFNLKGLLVTRSPLKEESTIKDTLDLDVKPVEEKQEEEEEEIEMQMEMEKEKEKEETMELEEDLDVKGDEGCPSEYFIEDKCQETIPEVEDECTQQTQNFRDQVIEVSNDEFLLIHSIEPSPEKQKTIEERVLAEIQNENQESLRVIDERRYKKLSLNLEKLKQESICDLEKMDSKRKRIRRKKKASYRTNENQLKSTVRIKGKKRDNQKKMKSAKKEPSKSPVKYQIDLKTTSSRAFHKKRVASTDMQGSSLLEQVSGSCKKGKNRSASKASLPSHRPKMSRKEESLRSFRSSQLGTVRKQIVTGGSSYLNNKLSPYQEDLTKMVTRNPSANNSFYRSEKSVTDKSVSSAYKRNRKSKVQISQECLKRYYMYNEKLTRPKTSKRNSSNTSKTNARRLSQQALSNLSEERNAYFAPDEYELQIHDKQNTQNTIHSHQVTSRTRSQKHSSSHQNTGFQQRGSVEIGECARRKELQSFISRQSKQQFNSFGGTTANSCSGHLNQQAPFNQDALSNSNCDLPSHFNSNFGCNERSILYQRNSQSYQTGEEMKSLNWRVQSLARVKIPSQFINSDNSYQQNHHTFKKSPFRKRKKIRASHKHLKKESLAHSHSETAMKEITNKVPLKSSSKDKKKVIRKNSAFKATSHNPLVQDENFRDDFGIKTKDPENDYFVCLDGRS